MYSEKLLDHFRNPRNMGRIAKPDGVGKVGNPICGDVLVLYIKVKAGLIANIKFETLGCAAAIGTSSVVTGLAKGKTLAQAEKISSADIIKAVGGLPPVKTHCSLLAVDALRAAIKNYREKHKK